MRRGRSTPALAWLLEGVGSVVLPLLLLLNRALRRLTAATHRAQAIAVGVLGGERDWHDHHTDVSWKWPSTGGWEPLARGVLSGLAIREGARVLDIGSGDGFFARHFYASRAEEVIGVDQDRRAVSHARRVNRDENLSFQRGDIRSELPEGPFDNAIWDNGINYLTRREAISTLRGIRERLAPGGLLSGVTDREPERSTAELNVFADAADLAGCLHEAFPHVCVLEFSAGSRHIFQFYAAMEESSIPIARLNPAVTWLGGGRR
jgi:SAM-dependent methyltransferase